MVFNFIVDFYKEADGNKPLSLFIKSLNTKMKAKVVANLHLLEEYGNFAREPLSKYLGDGILNFGQLREMILFEFFISLMKGK